MEGLELEMTCLPDSNFWRHEKVLITGDSGFKGSWLAIWLRMMGAEVFGLSLEPEKGESLYWSADVQNLVRRSEIDVRNADKVDDWIAHICPSIVFHLAAQPLVFEGYESPRFTFGTNVMGVVNVLDTCLRYDSVNLVLVITTDKVYQGLSSRLPHTESDTLWGDDPYSASKVCAELVASSYRVVASRSEDMIIATARAGNVIGGGDWAENRLIPDAIRAWAGGSDLYLRNPNSIRPWQHVLEPLSGYMALAEHLIGTPSDAGAFNFGPNVSEIMTVSDVGRLLAARLQFSLKLENDPPQFHEEEWLQLDSEKASKILGYSQVWDATKTIEKTTNWYVKHRGGASAYELCIDDIEAFIKDASNGR
jgi:CDP-glucose 4,6-dehydratase